MTKRRIERLGRRSGASSLATRRRRQLIAYVFSRSRSGERQCTARRHTRQAPRRWVHPCTHPGCAAEWALASSRRGRTHGAVSWHASSCAGSACRRAPAGSMSAAARGRSSGRSRSARRRARCWGWIAREASSRMRARAWRARGSPSTWAMRRRWRSQAMPSTPSSRGWWSTSCRSRRGWWPR